MFVVGDAVCGTDALCRAALAFIALLLVTSTHQTEVDSPHLEMGVANSVCKEDSGVCEMRHQIIPNKMHHKKLQCFILLIEFEFVN